ncbi:AAA family ATPase [Evansella tamaricis]|uniref:AAA family ATPase n=1 Tax=Evansella tamaricis TaxID=2069301 RepID=A0ABS6JK10_9BACI|nr:AAA family ATPase [Evansella tamaricis]MBU9714010.1 AAA family ATPase [Evansella tamaricis]
MSEGVQTNTIQQGKVVAVCSAKGGIGKTLISVNLAVSLIKKNLNVCLIDGDFQFGDVSVAMDLTPTYTIRDIIEEIEDLESNTVTNFLTRHSSGVSVLAAPERPEYADLVVSEKVITIINKLRDNFDYIIVDCDAGIQGTTLEMMEIADEILVITNLEMTALKNTKLMLETLGKLEFREKSQLIINRYTMESLIKAEDVPKMLGEEKVISIPNNFKLASQSLNLGIPFVISQGKSDLAKAVFKMTESLVSKNGIVERKKENQSLLKKLFPSPR